MLRRYFRRVLELEDPPPKTDEEALSPPAFPCNLHERFSGVSVPEAANSDPSDSRLYAEFFEHILVAPARERGTVVVFPDYLAPGERRGEYGVREFRKRYDDLEDVGERIYCARRIYERIYPPAGERHPRIVDYAGATSTGYKLERLFPGPMDRIDGLKPVDAEPKLLLLYQRWALQILSALEFLHSKGVILYAISNDIFWLREDLSIAVAGLICAACDDLGIETGPWSRTAMPDNPWGEGVVCSHFDRFNMHPEKDIFDWATWMYGLMTDENPLEHGLGPLDSEPDMGTCRRRCSQVRRREYHDWPTMREEMLGSVVVNAWEGCFESAAEALQEARKVLKASGVELSTEPCDEIEGVDWRAEFVIENTAQRYWPDILLRPREKSEHVQDGPGNGMPGSNPGVV